VHIVGVERGWLTCWKEPSPSSTFVRDYWTRHNALFNPNAFPDLAAVQLKWAEIEREQVEFVNRVTNESSGRMLPVYGKTNQSGATSCNIWQKPFHLPSGSSLAN